MTLTKEWLLKTIAELEEERDAIPGAVNEDAAMALAAMKLALASLGAEPVGYFYADKPGDWYQISDGDRVPDHRRIPLYSSPQSGPVVKLPNEFISNEGIVVQIEKVMAVLAVAGIRYERKGNACREAMLQGAAGNSPAIPDSYDIESFGIFRASEGSSGFIVEIDQFRFGTEKCPQIGKTHMVPKFALQAIINALQQHCDSMEEVPSLAEEVNWEAK